MPRLSRAVVITRDRLLVLDCAAAEGAATAAAAPEAAAEGAGSSAAGGADASAAADEAAPAEVVKEAQLPAPLAAAAAADGAITAGSAATADRVDAADGAAAAEGLASGLLGCSGTVKSNHHLTEIQKMTLLKKVFFFPVKAGLGSCDACETCGGLRTCCVLRNKKPSLALYSQRAVFLRLTTCLILASQPLLNLPRSPRC